MFYGRRLVPYSSSYLRFRAIALKLTDIWRGYYLLEGYLSWVLPKSSSWVWSRGLISVRLFDVASKVFYAENTVLVNEGLFCIDYFGDVIGSETSNILDFSLYFV